MNHRYLLVVCTLILTACIPCFAGLSPCNVAVVVNVDSSASEAVGRYYCEKAGIPLSNLIEVQTLPADGVNPAQFATLAQQIRAKLVSRLGVDPDDFANDTIQSLVMCYGVPFRINYPTKHADGTPDTSWYVNNKPREADSVDSFLTLLFNANPDLGPSPGVFSVMANPYFGKNIDFASFRASVDNSTLSGSTLSGSTIYKMRYMVCRLDA